MTDKQALREAAEKYRTTYAAHLKNPRNYDALDAWDKATSEFMALVNNDELNIIASLIDEIDMETGYREGRLLHVTAGIPNLERQRQSWKPQRSA